jgi:hypothetical protein
MPAKDVYHDLVVKMLRRERWNVIQEQVLVTIPKRKLWIDLRVQNSMGEKALVEVKSFLNVPSPVEYLSAALGKYILYRAILDSFISDEPLFMAVPRTAYDGILNEPVGQIAIDKGQLKLVVFGLLERDKLVWIP